MTDEARHCYFKFGKANTHFEQVLDNPEELKVGNEIDLAVYFGAWKPNEYRENSDLIFVQFGKNGKRMNGISVNQIKLFFELENSENNFYFWIFHRAWVYCFTPVEKKIHAGHEPDENGSYPKSVNCKLLIKKEKIKLPEVFSNINANQKYNRKTIVRLEGVEEEIAKKIVASETIKVDLSSKEIFKYMSPTEFETLCFLIFNNGTSFSSSYRGSTLKDYDIRAYIQNDIYHESGDRIPKGDYWIQVKKKSTKIKPKEGMYLFHSDPGDIPNRIIGYEWILESINRCNLIDWLKYSIFRYDLYKLSS